MTPYAYTDYRKFLRDRIQAERKSRAKFSAASLAKSAGIQRSYLSAVLGGRADLNADQLFVLGGQLHLRPEELDYILLLLEIERCQLKSRKELLVAKRDRIIREHLKSETYLDRPAMPIEEFAYVDYFSTPLCSIVHMFMAIEAYRKNPLAISQRLRASEKEVQEALSILERCGLLRATKMGFEVDFRNRHLSGTTRLSRLRSANLRLKAVEHQQRLDNPDDYFFSNIFAADERTRTALHTKLLEVVQEAARMIEPAPSENVYALNLDLFSL